MCCGPCVQRVLYGLQRCPGHVDQQPMMTSSKGPNAHHVAALLTTVATVPGVAAARSLVSGCLHSQNKAPARAPAPTSSAEHGGVGPAAHVEGFCCIALTHVLNMISPAQQVTHTNALEISIQQCISHILSCKSCRLHCTFPLSHQIPHTKTRH